MDKSSNAVNGASANQAHSPRPTLARESSTASMRRLDLAQATKQTPQSLQASQPASAATSASASPFASREPSPARPSARSHNVMKVVTAAAAAAAAATPPTFSTQSASSSSSALPKHPAQPSSTSATSASPSIRSRRNSPQETSPSRSRTSIPTPAATQKAGALSSATTPSLPPAASDASTGRASGPQKSEQPRDSPRWPVSPRLRSPPPILNRPNLPPSATTSDIPTISLQRTAGSSPSLDAVPAPTNTESEDLALQPGMRTPVRGASGNVPTLETVQEASPLAGARAVDAAALEKLEVSSVPSEAGNNATMPEVAEVSPAKTIRARQHASQNYESGSENGSTKNNRRTAAASGSVPPLLASRNSSTIKLAGKGKSGEAASQPTMTVETETVTSIPNVALGPSAAQGPNSSLRTKPSSETIRPKKEKKKTTRKQATVTPGTATSKADIFEAKVASAVDEANTSDSEETFVYDSNPADSRDRPHRFHHSRTPSATSLANNQNGMRSIHSILEGAGPSTAVKKGMKFVNTFNNTSGNDSGLGDDETKAATIRGVTPGSGRGTARLHHHVGASGSHIGRWGLNGPKNGHQSILDSESPFPVNSASRLKASLGGGANGSTIRRDGGATSPRPSVSSMTGRGNGGLYSQKRGFGPGAGVLGYDMDDTTPGQADDERTPLIPSSMRGPGRGPRTRRHHMSLRSLEQQSYHNPTASFLNRFASCLVLTVMLMLVISGAIGFMFATSQPLEDIELVKISGVIASEQELMFDLMVRAHNPNVVVVTVDSADMEVFAKSPHAGTDSEWWRRPRDGDSASTDADLDVDELDNEPRDQPDSSPNFLLGKFTEFDNPLSFEGSFFHHGLSTSRSGVRIRWPGNGTDGGSERWERILDDEFDLIIKGVLRYSLPLSQRVRSALIEGRTKVKPNAADDPTHPPNGTATINMTN
ncbi:Vacuolar inheritance and morphology protein [Sporothrix curviconia]|uniref:Vacuolar inheritance and morphology protein n=1 Tax=Sporothrix curviconia TaxID=1260050 RepID=A0ABP0BTJ7_9PEZI